MSTRYIAYANAGASSQSFNGVQQNAMVADGDIFQALCGTTAVFWGLQVTPGTGLSVNIAPGGLTSYTQVDPSGVGGFVVNTNYCVKKAALAAVFNETGFTAPSSGQAINYLLEASFLSTQVNSQPINYKYQNANGTVSSSTGASQPLQITDTVSFQLKNGTPANVGTQVTPGVDNGWIPIAVITVPGGATSLTQANISVPANAPTIMSVLGLGLGLSSYATIAQMAGLYVPQSQLALGAVAGSVPERDPNGSLWATNFHGVADTATLANTATYAATAGNATTANTAAYATSAGSANNAQTLGGMSVTNNAAPNSIPQLDGGGNLTVVQLNGTASQALNAQTLQNYQPSVSTSAGTVAVRDASGNLSANVFNGDATSANFSDLAERYQASEAMGPGDLVEFGGAGEVQLARTSVFSAVSTAPAVRMNETAGSDAEWPMIAHVGRVPVKVIGPVQKFDLLTLSDRPGVAVPTDDPSKAFGRALADNTASGLVLVLAHIRSGV